MLHLRGVSKAFQGKTVLWPLDLEFPGQQTHVLVGPSGCGKSTLLKLILRLITPETGEVLIDGQPITRENELQVRRRIGYVIQDGGLFPHLKAADNVSLVARYLRWTPERIEARLVELADLTKFPRDGLRRYPAQLSGGQRQRLGLMRALMVEPEILLMDEPLGALDPIIRSELQTDLRGIFRRLNKTVILVTHDLHEAAYLADQIVLLREGKVIQRGTMSDLVYRPADPFVTTFVNAQRTTELGAST